ncbi:unnamed protein product, partial [Meganyctiphanes norvegica]
FHSSCRTGITWILVPYQSAWIIVITREIMDYQYQMDLSQQKPSMTCDENLHRYFVDMNTDTSNGNVFSGSQIPAVTQIVDVNMDNMEDSEVFEFLKATSHFGEPDYSKFHSNKALGIELSMANSNQADAVADKELVDYEADSDVNNQNWTFTNVNGNNPCASLSEIRDDLGMLTDDELIKALEMEDVSGDCGAIEGRSVHVHVQRKKVVAQKTRTMSQMQLFDKTTNSLFNLSNEMDVLPNEIMDEDVNVFDHSDVKFHKSEKMFEHEDMMMRRFETVFVKTEDTQTLRSRMSQGNEDTPYLRETVNSITQVEQYCQNVQSVSLQTDVMYRKRKIDDIDHNHFYSYPNG